MLLPPIPAQSPVATLPSATITQPWLTLWRNLLLAVNAATQQLQLVSKTAQGASLPTTAFQTTTLPAGLYRVQAYARITQPGTVSSSLTITIGWTDGGVACSQAFAAMTGNTTSTVQSDELLIRIDNATTVTYATAYASVGATSMLYAIDLTLEEVPS